MTRGARLLPVAAVGAIAVLAATASSALAQEGWSIGSFDVRIVVLDGGDLLVQEDIAVDFGSLERHGTLRDLPVRYDVPPDPPYALPAGAAPEDLQRVIEIDDIEVTSPTAPADLELSEPGPTGGAWLRMRIGDPDTTITGAHRYTLRYRVRGALDRFDGQPELFWNATGTGWPVPIRSASAVVEGGTLTDTNCFRGGVGATDVCAVERISDGAARFATEGLQAGEGMSVAVRFAPGSVTVPPPILRERWSVSNALYGSAAAVPLTVLTAIVGIGGVLLLAYREGRDRVLRGTATAAGTVDRARADERRRGVLEARVVPVRFRPPQDLRPAQLGLIVDESVDPVDISATIVDLATRGHVVIEEQTDKVLWFSRTDWTLRRTDPAQRADVRQDLAEIPLLAFERELLDRLFADGDEVQVSDLKGSFHRDYAAVERRIYEDGQSRHWFAKRPDRVRSAWLVVGAVVTAAAIGLLVLAALFTQVALAAVPLIVAGVVLMVAHRRMPHRTGAGSRLLEDTLGFREFVETADADRLRFAEAEDLFLPYLPYAVVFGATERWARAFADLGLAPADLAPGWYVGAHAFNAARLSSGLSEFSSSVGTSLATVPSSSSGGGFSGGSVGGGFGGGGGGSW